VCVCVCLWAHAHAKKWDVWYSICLVAKCFLNRGKKKVNAQFHVRRNYAGVLNDDDENLLQFSCLTIRIIHIHTHTHTQSSTHLTNKFFTAHFFWTKKIKQQQNYWTTQNCCVFSFRIRCTSNGQYKLVLFPKEGWPLVFVKDDHLVGNV
jgi:hypothetical protein